MEIRTEPRTRSSASLKDILGAGDSTLKIEHRWKRHYHFMTELRDKILQHQQHMSDSAKEEQASFSLHMGDAGTDQYDCDFALSMVSADQNAIYEIDEALNRIRRGGYGICELSGQPIEEERLDALPWARFSAAAQRELEEKGAVTMVKFGKQSSGNLFGDAGSADEDEDEE